MLYISLQVHKIHESYSIEYLFSKLKYKWKHNRIIVSNSDFEVLALWR